jgi:hypothetical protein
MEYCDKLIASLNQLPEKEQAPVRRQTASAGGLPTHMMENLDNVQRLAILNSVAAGRVSVDEALGLVRDYYNAEHYRADAPPPPPPPAAEASQEDLDSLFDVIDRSQNSSFHDQRSAPPPPLISMEDTGPVAPPRKSSKARASFRSSMVE